MQRLKISGIIKTVTVINIIVEDCVEGIYNTCFAENNALDKRPKLI